MSPRSQLRSLLAAGLVLTVAACASSGSKGASSGASTAGRASSDSSRRSTTNIPSATGVGTTGRANILTVEDIRKVQLANVYDVVSTLRPRWLQTRGADSFQRPTQIQVYVGNTRLQGGLEALRDVASLGVMRIEWVDGISASSRWGLDHGAGAIVVSLTGK